jgi:hypothetical protein
VQTVLIVSPHFPPINAPDMQRVRMSLPYFEQFGWKPIVLAVDANHVEGVEEPLLIRSIPSHIPIYRVPALPINWTRPLGLGSVAMRALPFLYRKGCELIKTHNVDLIYFSTTLFPSMPLGRIWKSQFNIPFVLDIQDPWVSDYKQERFTLLNSPKHWLMRKVHRASEPWTMAKVDGLISVSAPYLEVLSQRYPRLKDIPQKTITFAGSSIDFELISKSPHTNAIFKPSKDQFSCVYLGRGGADLELAASITFDAFKKGLVTHPDLFSRLRMYFVGTSYANGVQAKKTIEPVAGKYKVIDYITEIPHRQPYFEVLQLMKDTDVLLILGSDDSQYTASKLYPYILACKPLILVAHQSSSLVEIVKTTNSGFIVAFENWNSLEESSDKLFKVLNEILPKLPFAPDTNWKNFNQYTAQTMTEKQCNLLSTVFHSYSIAHG